MRSDATKLRKSKTPQLQEQLAAYAIEMFSARGVRQHVLGLFIDTLAVEFWYYDRSSGYGSMPCSFGYDFRAIGILLLAIGNASAKQLGFVPHIRPPPVDGSILSTPFGGPPKESSILTKCDGTWISVNQRPFVIEGERLGKGRTLIGRGEFVHCFCFVFVYRSLCHRDNCLQSARVQ